MTHVARIEPFPSLLAIPERRCQSSNRYMGEMLGGLKMIPQPLFVTQIQLQAASSSPFIDRSQHQVRRLFSVVRPAPPIMLPGANESVSRPLPSACRSQTMSDETVVGRRTARRSSGSDVGGETRRRRRWNQQQRPPPRNPGRRRLPRQRSLRLCRTHRRSFRHWPLMQRRYPPDGSRPPLSSTRPHSRSNCSPLLYNKYVCLWINCVNNA